MRMCVLIVSFVSPSLSFWWLLAFGFCEGENVKAHDEARKGALAVGFSNDVLALARAAS